MIYLANCLFLHNTEMSSSRLADLREKSKKRKEYLKVTLGVDNLAEALGSESCC